MSRQDDIKKLIITNQRRLQLLKEKQAIKGVDVEPAVIIEIEDIEAEIEKLQTELTAIESRAASSPLDTKNWSQTTKVVSGLGLFCLIVVFRRKGRRGQKTDDREQMTDDSYCVSWFFKSKFRNPKPEIY